MTVNTEKQNETTQEERRCRGRPQLRPDDETRGIIHAAARHEFAENGFAATSMESVARRAGVSTKTLYRLIPTKAALFESMVDKRIERFVAKVNLRGCEHENIETALEKALVICAELVLDRDVVAINRMILSERDTFPEFADAFYEHAMQRTSSALADWLRARALRGLITLDNPDEAAGMLLGMLIFAPQRASLYARQPVPDAQTLTERARACAKLFLQGCAAVSPARIHA
jgi:AcrR family transcriptional regulator